MNLTLFDLDGTLLPQDSDHLFGEFMVALGWADGAAFKQRNDSFFADYQAGRLNMDAYIEFATAPWRQRSAAAIDAAFSSFMADWVQPLLTDAARELVQRHVQAGDRVVVVTATNEFVTRPIAQALGVKELIATELALDASGRVTGAIRGVPSFREGKITRVHAWLQAQGLAWQQVQRSTFYSDSTNDLPLLEHVTHPVVTNPSPALQRIALERGWPQLKLFS
jgi:HAD superfamily hydrolase (TIGR01490 family)